MRKTFYDFVNKEMSFTFGSSVAVRVIHEEIQEIHRHRFQSIHKFFFLLNLIHHKLLLEEPLPGVLSLSGACFMKPV